MKDCNEVIDILRGAIEDIIMDLENNGEIYMTDEARITRLRDALEESGLVYRPDVEDEED